METAELLDAARERLGLPSDYALAKHLGISHQALYKLKTRNGRLRDELAVKVAEALGKDPGLFLLELHAARTECPAARQALNAVAARVTTAGLALATVLGHVEQCILCKIGELASSPRLCAFCAFFSISLFQSPKPIISLPSARGGKP